MKNRYTLGNWQIEPGKNAIRTVQIPEQLLRPKVMQILSYLAKRSNETVSREELIDAVWQGNYLVGDRGLTDAIWQLRKTLDKDESLAPYIETIPKTGYRLLKEPILHEPKNEDKRLANSTIHPFIKFSIWSIIILIISFAFYYFNSDKQLNDMVYIPTSQTSLSGIEFLPALSPNGKYLAFSHIDSKRNRTLRIKDASNKSDNGKIFSVGEHFTGFIAWSPESDELAYILKQKNGVCAINILDVVTEQITEVTNCITTALSLSWSADGNYLAYTDRLLPISPTGIVIYNFLSKEKKQLTVSENIESIDDYNATWSPDSKRILFIRSIGVGNNAIYQVDLNGKIEKIISPEGDLAGIAFAADNNTLLYSLKYNSKSFLWSINLDNKSTQRISIQSTNISNPTYSKETGMLAFVQVPFAKKLKLLNLDTHSKKIRVTNFFNSDSAESYPSYSAINKKLVYISNKDNEEMWETNIEGDKRKKLTNLDVDIYGPSWSPDGRYIAFTASVKKIGFKQIHLYDSKDASIKALTSDPWDHAPPTWSADSQHIYSGQLKDGTWYLWQLDLVGNQQQFINDAAIYTLQSTDGNRVFYSKGEKNGIWEQLNENSSALLIADLGPGDGSNWVVIDNGIYYLSRTTEADNINFYSFITKQISLIITLPRSTISYIQNFTYLPETEQLIFVEGSFIEMDIYSIDYHNE